MGSTNSLQQHIVKTTCLTPILLHVEQTSGTLDIIKGIMASQWHPDFIQIWQLFTSLRMCFMLIFYSLLYVNFQYVASQSASRDLLRQQTAGKHFSYKIYYPSLFLTFCLILCYVWVPENPWEGFRYGAGLHSISIFYRFVWKPRKNAVCPRVIALFF